ncbi:MAG TPA: hydantoinase/oxoprolinase family protein, partial [Candidatus Aquilonibacter sp.]
MIRVGVDIGGTFTDATVFDDTSKQVTFGKSLTTPENLVRGVLAAIDETGAGVDDASVIIHGSTIAINALLERKGARTALLTTLGFRDVYEIGRINRPDAFNLFFKKHRPLVPRELIFEVEERMQADGSAWIPLREDAARSSAALLEGKAIESVAIVFLHSYRNPQHEVQMRETLLAMRPDLFVSTSAEISREYREYERTSTAVANAFIGPKVSRYLGDLDAALRERAFGGALMIMQSSGGLYDIETARRQCIHMLESGPAGGVVGASALCETLAIDKAICFDMGGTTAKAAVVQRGVVGLSPDYFIGSYNDGLAIRIPVVDIKEVGTGGGS